MLCCSWFKNFDLQQINLLKPPSFEVFFLILSLLHKAGWIKAGTIKNFSKNFSWVVSWVDSFWNLGVQSKFFIRLFKRIDSKIESSFKNFEDSKNIQKLNLDLKNGGQVVWITQPIIRVQQFHAAYQTLLKFLNLNSIFDPRFYFWIFKTFESWF